MRTFGIADLWFIVEAAKWTLALSLVAFIGGMLLGLVVALARTAEHRAVRAAATVFVRIFQGTPLLLQLFLVFFGAPVLGLDLTPWLAAGIALILNTAAFLGEIWRGCIEAIPRGQWEASASLALSLREQLRHVIGPQALRIAVAPTVGFAVQLIKGTALASVIGFIELTKAGTMITNATLRPFTVYACVAGMYFALCWPVSAASRRLERKLTHAR